MDKDTHTHIYIYVHTHTHTHIYIYVYSGILFSQEKNEIILFAATWLDLEIIILSEVIQTKTNII